MSVTNDKKIFNYISYFSDDTVQFCKWQHSERQEDDDFTLGYPVYDDRLSEFIQDIYDSGIMVGNYMEVTEGIFSSNGKVIEIIKNLDNFETARAILTYYVRQDRFSEGSLGRAAENKILLNILLKLKELT